MDLTTCPACGNLAEIQWRDVLESTDGPIEHAKVVCVDRHWFVMPVSSLASPPMPERAQSPQTVVRRGRRHVVTHVPGDESGR